jgi:dihydrofolate reductase
MSDRQVILYAAVSLDGFIADSEGKVEWLSDPALRIEQEEFGYAEFYDSIDTTLMGYKTYEDILGFDLPFPYSDKVNYVFSRRERPAGKWVRIVNSEIPEFIRSLKAQKGKHIWLVGGAQLNAFFLDHELIDRIILTVAPMVLGKGIPIFRGPSSIHYLEHLETRSFDKGWLQLIYDLRKGS